MNRNLQSFNVKGERCSGTTYLQKLVETNLNVPCIQEDIGWKHGFVELTKASLGYSDIFLTIIIFRNVFDWVRSFYQKPHHLQGTQSGLWKRDKRPPSFSEFIRQEVYQIDRFDKELIRERHPVLLTRPKNILELRKWKIENFINLRNILPNTYYVKYEDLISIPSTIIAEINNKGFNQIYTYRNWDNYKDTSTAHKSKTYPPIRDEDMEFIIKNTDWNMENEIGYYEPTSC